MSESRLDRLLKLIDTAPSPAYRRLAAKQLGALIKAQPNEARSLLLQLDGYLFSKNWDTRIATGYAIEYIFSSIPELFSATVTNEMNPSALLLQEMDLISEVSARKPLLASAGSEFDLDLTISAAERLKISRANVKKTLGFDGISGMEELERELVKDEDLTSTGTNGIVNNNNNPISNTANGIDLEKLSARERQALKRKARLNSQVTASKQVKRNLEDNASGGMSVNTSTSSLSVSVNNDNNITPAVPIDYLDSFESDALWFCEKMKERLLNPNWNVRHGALIGLKSVLTNGLPVISPGSVESVDGWIDFLLADILLVLGLDRFGDFIGDQVISPVKETAAQVFALIFSKIQHYPIDGRRECLIKRHVKSLLQFEQWQVRHAGLLSIKHILGQELKIKIKENNNDNDNEQDRSFSIGNYLNPQIISLLSDGDEDVRSVAADVLSLLISTKISLPFNEIFGILQNLLEDLDELSPSVGSILDLLGNILGLNPDLIINPRRIIAFVRHSSTRVRRQVVKVLGMQQESVAEEDILNLLMQSIAIETNREISDLTCNLVCGIKKKNCTLTTKSLDNLLVILACPVGTPYSASNFNLTNNEHDLGFKKADMMLIGEEEGILQRINLALCIKNIFAYDSACDYALQMDVFGQKLLSSHLCLHHLIYFWVFGHQIWVITEKEFVFTEISAFNNSLLNEFNRFVTLLPGKENKRLSKLNILSVKEVIMEYLTSPEKSLEAVNQYPTLQSTLEQYEMEHHKHFARFNVCHGEDQVKILIEALNLDDSTRLQEFYAAELINILKEDDSKQITSVSDVLVELGEFVSLHKLKSNRKHWQEYYKSDDSAWRGGQLFFAELSRTKCLLFKSVLDELIKLSSRNHQFQGPEINWIVALFKEINDVEDAKLLGKVLAFENVKELILSDENLICVSGSLLFSQIVRLQWLAKNCSALERFIHELLFSSPAQQVFSVILELLERVDEVAILPIIPILLRRTLREINDSERETRHSASLTFSQLIRLAPLASGTETTWSADGILSVETVKLIGECKEFLDQLQGPSNSLPDFVAPCEITVKLRPYQQDGLNWLAFLRKFNLHGALCDDMGLGKTLQTLTIIASDHFELSHQDQEEGIGKGEMIRSLIICPSSLTGHWEAEVRQYCPTLSNSVLVYAGQAADRRNKLQKLLSTSELVITSYDIIRTDSDLFSNLQWNYCVLDEGHLIKNPKTKLSTAIRGIRAKRRLLLSGTPIQNNLLELWALFEFLMPGYLGTEREFSEKYAKPIQVLQQQHQQQGTSGTTASTNGNISKWSQKDFDEAESKLKALHKQVLPFILRRMKEQVLKDLPPKIIQDYTCSMSSIQKIIYEDLLKSSALRTEISNYIKKRVISQDEKDETITTKATTTADGTGKEENSPANMHVFQALQYMRKLCIHPSLVLKPDHPLMNEIDSELKRENLKITDLSVAPKFQMLKELLIECGLGSGNSEENSNSTNTNTNTTIGGGASNVESDSTINLGGHRVLIFAQHKTTLDLIEKLVFKPHLSQISYLRLDGGVEPSARYPIVNKFNSDMTIDVLLLTTHVGGLGLNLTTADTVIFMDPDWNPMKDLQAMDRAHRLGQKRVVNVYRLLLKDTLEERIMGLQRWKMMVAGSVVSQQNSSMKTMGTETVLDLFESQNQSKIGESESKSKDSESESKGNTNNTSDSSSSVTEKWLKKVGAGGGEDRYRDDDGEDELNVREAEYDREFKI